MKALILRFESFQNKDKTKFYSSFDLYDIEGRQVHQMFGESRFTEIPGGEVPPADFFPAIADVVLKIDSYVDKEGKKRYQPRVPKITSWKSIDLKKL